MMMNSMIHIDVDIDVDIDMYIYIYIYIERERDIVLLVNFQEFRTSSVRR